jgi:uncharacterized coiled-coil DUF342 family protein
MSLAGAVIWLAAQGVVAQTNVNPTAQPTRTGQAVAPDKLTVNDVSTTANLRPARPERQNLPPEVKERLDRFKGAARAYLEQQEALKKQLNGANDEEREAIRKQLKALRDQWLEKAREMRKEFRERAEEMRTKIPELDEVIQSARDAATESTRPRRGDERP